MERLVRRLGRLVLSTLLLCLSSPVVLCRRLQCSRVFGSSKHGDGTDRFIILLQPLSVLIAVLAFLVYFYVYFNIIIPYHYPSEEFIKKASQILPGADPPELFLPLNVVICLGLFLWVNVAGNYCLAIWKDSSVYPSEFNEESLISLKQCKKCDARMNE